jgi:hypothetical protein
MPFWLERASLAGLPGLDAWRLSESELWLPADVILKVVKTNFNRAHELAHRLAVARI